jgi:hypothetical protein
MIRPVNFSFNKETAVNNAFQQPGYETDAQEHAVHEFDNMVLLLRSNDIEVTVINDTPEPATPDSIFPNNWISFHSDGHICLYPMFAANRRMERKPFILEELAKEFQIRQKLDLTYFEEAGQFLEGTGSMVLDRDNKIAYACLSERTHPKVLDAFCNRMDYTPLSFKAFDNKGMPIYHSNVMMCVADSYVVICTESIRDTAERAQVEESILRSGKDLFPISLQQMESFAGNMLQVENTSGRKFLLMSSTAWHSLSEAQQAWLEKRNSILHSPLNSIEKNGGGSARCMMAEIFLPLKEKAD